MISGNTAGRQSCLRRLSKDPVRNVDVMRPKLRQKAERVLVVETPVDESLKRRIGHRPAPVVVTMPVAIDVRDIPDLAPLTPLDPRPDPSTVPILLSPLLALL